MSADQFPKNPPGFIPIRLFNSLSRTEEVMCGLPGTHVKFYACGPTVYSYAHIGNFRSFLTADLIVRLIRYQKCTVTFVTNITDVGHLTDDDVADSTGEDKMARALKSKEGERFANIWDLARHYTESMLNDWAELNLTEPDVRPRATEHVSEQIKMISALIDSGHAYVTDDSVYFHVPSFPGYGKLSGNTGSEDLLVGVREVVSDTAKRDPRDFALWKRDDHHLMQWHSPWGWGFPGWHIECSAMAEKYLGPTFDLHSGGEDNAFPHHECEIAQSEALLPPGESFARHWVHTRFLLVDGQKMAKSAGNFFTVRDLIAPVEDGGRGVPPLALRYALIAGHYRKQLDFSLDGLAAAAKIVQRFADLDKAVAEAVQADRPGDDTVSGPLRSASHAMLSALTNDLNTPQALAAAIEGTKVIYAAGDLTGASARSAGAFLDDVDDLLGIVRAQTTSTSNNAAADPVAALVEARIAERAAARSAKDWARSDAIREALDARGVELLDGKGTTTWRRKLTV